MKRTFAVILLLVCFLASCIGQGKQVAVASPTAARSTATPFSTSTRRFTRTPRDTWTPWSTSTAPSKRNAPASTSTIDPIFFSTFDPKITPTQIYFGPQMCPAVNSALKPNFPDDDAAIMGDSKGFFHNVLDFLNAGGTPSNLHDFLVKDKWNLDANFWAVQDLTGEGVPEVVMAMHGVHVFMCIGGKYMEALNMMTGDDPIPNTSILAIKDMNRDKVPELVLKGGVMSAGVFYYRILEWDGMTFQSLIWSEKQLLPWFDTPIGKVVTWYSGPPSDYPSEDQYATGIVSTESIQDTDGNGTLELIIKNNIALPNRLDGGPFGKTTDSFQWNGTFFSLARITIDAPIYRFQAVQEADRLSLAGEYAKALGLYQEAISNSKLLAWSQENYLGRLDDYSGTPTPTIIPFNQDEHDSLAAYANYRILLIDLIQNKQAEAGTKYADLVKSFPQDKAGYIYTELATYFWNSYGTSHNIGEACSRVIQFVDEHQDSIFTYLGNVKDAPYAFGNQSHFYTSWDLCPFK